FTLETRPFGGPLYFWSPAIVRGFLFGENGMKNGMKFVTYDRLRPDYGIPYSNRQLKRLEAKGLFPKRIPLVVGGSLKGWTDVVLGEQVQKRAEMSKADSERPSD